LANVSRFAVSLSVQLPKLGLIRIDLAHGRVAAWSVQGVQVLLHVVILHAGLVDRLDERFAHASNSSVRARTLPE
jgi:hypothetical protein